MSITLDEYKAPDAVLDKKIDHYRDIMTHAQARIQDLNNIKKSRDNLRRHRQRLNDLADKYAKLKPNACKKQFVAEIRTELRCDTTYAQNIADMVRKRVKAREIAKRNEQIRLLAEYLPKTELARKFKISRQQVHNILKENPDYF